MKNAILVSLLASLTVGCANMQPKIVQRDFQNQSGGGVVKYFYNADRWAKDSFESQQKAHNLVAEYCGEKEFKILSARTASESEWTLIFQTVTDYKYDTFQCTEGKNEQKVSKK